MSAPATTVETIDPLESHVELSPNDIAIHVHRLVTATLDEFPIETWEKSPKDDLESVLANEEDVYDRRAITRDLVREAIHSTDVEKGLARIQEKLGDNVTLQPFDDAQYLITSKKVSAATNKSHLQNLRKLHSDIGEAIAEAPTQDVLKSSIILLQALHQQYFGVRVKDLIQIMQEHGISNPLLMQCIEATNNLSLGFKAAKICVRNGIVIVGNKNNEVIIPEQETSTKEYFKQEEARQIEKVLAPRQEEAVKRKILEHLAAQPNKQISRKAFEEWYFDKCKEASSPPKTMLSNLRAALGIASDLVIISDPTEGGSDKYRAANTKESDILKLRFSPQNLTLDLPEKELKYTAKIKQLALPDEDQEPKGPPAAPPAPPAPSPAPEPAPTLPDSPVTEEDIRFLIGDIKGHKESPRTTKKFLQIFLEAVTAGHSVKRNDLNLAHIKLSIKYAFSNSLRNFRQFLEPRGYALLETPVDSQKKDKGENILTIVRVTASGEPAPQPPAAPPLNSVSDIAQAVAQLEEEKRRSGSFAATIEQLRTQLENLGHRLEQATEASQMSRGLLDLARDELKKQLKKSATHEEEIQRLQTKLTAAQAEVEKLSAEQGEALATDEPSQADPAGANAEQADKAALQAEIADLQQQLAAAKQAPPQTPRPTAPSKPEPLPTIKTMAALQTELQSLRKKYLTGKKGILKEVIIKMLVDVQSLIERSLKVEMVEALQEIRDVLALTLGFEKRFVDGKAFSKLVEVLTLDKENTNDADDTDDAGDDDTSKDKGHARTDDDTVVFEEEGELLATDEDENQDDDDSPDQPRTHRTIGPFGVTRRTPTTPSPTPPPPAPTPLPATPDTPPPTKPPIPYSLPDIDTAFTTIPGLSRSLSTLRTSVIARPTVSGAEAITILRTARVFESRGQDTVTRALKRFHERCDQKIAEVDALIRADEKGRACRISTKTLDSLLAWRF